MKTVEVMIEGVTPLLMNRFTEDNEVKISAGVSGTTVGNKGTPREQAAKTAYRDNDGMLYVPGPNVFRSIIEAGKYHKAGKSKVTTQKSSMIPAGISLNGVVLPLGTSVFEVDSRSVVIPSTGGRIMKHRARLDSWKLKFTLEIDETMFGVSFVRQLVDDAGRRIGLGDYRPDRKGPFGKFVVIHWQEL
ncbi:MAG: hypothetical protein GXY41_05960 [Phycisphaerae bacterium]|nr:hypothetical protein [Phycisphaerae bacterium]